MGLFFKSMVLALLGSIGIIIVGQMTLKPNTIQSYPNIKPLGGAANNIPGLADVDAQSPMAQAAEAEAAKNKASPSRQPVKDEQSSPSFEPPAE